MRELVEKIIKYTGDWSISETEWYSNVECVRKPINSNDKEITWEEFERAVREEALYDLVYNNGSWLCNQMQHDLCEYGIDNLAFQNASKELEKEVQKYIKNFKLKR